MKMSVPADREYEFQWVETPTGPRLQVRVTETVCAFDVGRGGVYRQTGQWSDVPVAKQSSPADVVAKPNPIEDYDITDGSSLDGSAAAVAKLIGKVSDSFRTLAANHSYWQGWPGTQAFARRAVKTMIDVGLLSIDNGGAVSQGQLEKSFFSVISPAILESIHRDNSNELEVRRIWDKVRLAVAHHATKAPVEPTGGLYTFRPNGEPVQTDVVIDVCDQGHRFAKLLDHPVRDGRPRCVHCLAQGFDSLRKA